MGGSSKRECLDPKKCLDPKTIIRERCEVCIKKYNAVNRALNRKKKKDLIKETRSVVDKKRSIYSKILCDLCKEKQVKEFCPDCKNKYGCAKRNKSYRNKVEIAKENNRPTVINQPNQTNQPNQIDQQNPFNVVSSGSISAGDNDSEIVCSVDSSSADINNKRLSMYANLFCKACQTKSHKELCPECKLEYSRVTTNKSYAKNKCKKSLETIDLNNQSNLSDLVQQFRDDSVSCSKSSSKKRRPNSAKTIINKVSKARKIAGPTPERQGKVACGMIKTLPEYVKENIKRQLFSDSEQDQLAKVSAKVVQDIKKKFGAKSDVSYQAMDSVKNNFEGQTQSQTQKYLGINWDTAGKVRSRVDIYRKVYRKKLTQEKIAKIEKFYERDDISRIEPSMKASKKWGPRRFLMFSIYDAYLVFKNEEIENQVCFSHFYKFRPKNVSIASKTPIISSLCPYCINIRLKIQKLCIPNLKNEHDLIKMLICDKGHNALEHADCIQNKCKECSDWVGKIETILSNGKYKDTDSFKWYTWKKESITRANGKKGVRRTLKYMDETFKDFKQELLEDIMNPAQRFSFVEHYMAQKIQYNAYKECYSSLKPGQCLMVQDFAKYRDIAYQDEIKSQFWTKKQVTMHPTVLFYRLEDGGEIQRLVVTHLSDITNHDAHLVHYMTLECISILKEEHPEIEWSKIFLWSDGCAAQYKGKISFYYLNKFPIDVERNFFASEHGKGPSDAETGLISMTLSNATKTRRAVIQDASDMHSFLTETSKNATKKGGIRIFKLVQPDDLQPLLEKFNGVKVSTLHGTCTRSLHQLKPSNQNGYLLQRPFSCFCDSCNNEKFENCDKKSFTNGIFSKHKLPSNDFCFEYLDNEAEEENEDELEINSNGYFPFFYNEEEEVIESEKQNIQLDQLAPGNYVVVALKSENKKRGISEFVGKIHTIEDNHEIIINYLEQDSKYKDKFRISNRDSDQQRPIELCDIIMLLPDPDCKHRGGLIFPSKIDLKRNFNI